MTMKETTTMTDLSELIKRVERAIYLELLHFRGPLAPSLLMVMSEPADTDDFRSWWKAQTAGPYRIRSVLKEPNNV